jgi:hypothetical protein
MRIVLALALLAASSQPTPADADPNEIACSRLGFSFAPVEDADEVYCYRFAHSEPSGGGGISDISAVYDHMLVYQGPEVIRITQARAGQNVYFAMRSLRGYIGEFDELRGTERWSDETGYDDYSVSRFSAKMGGRAVVCFAFLKTGAATISRRGSVVGPSSFIVGYDCQFGSGEPSRSLIERTLAAIK